MTFGLDVFQGVTFLMVHRLITVKKEFGFLLLSVYIIQDYSLFRNGVNIGRLKCIQIKVLSGENSILN